MMADMLSAMVTDAQAWAAPQVSAYASGNRLYLVRITRPSVVPTFDRASFTFVPNTDDPQVYEGPARLYPVAGGPSENAEEETTDVSALRISIDAVTDLAPRLDDLVEVLANDVSIAANVAGRWFTVTDVEVGGFFSYGWSLTGRGVAPSRRTV